MREPLVSVCIPTLNGANFLRKALDSLFNQTYPNIEVIFSDDGSSDETLALINDFHEKAKFPVYVYKHIPSGIGANWNNCIRNSKGKYVKFLFQDDILYPDCIYELVKVFRTYPGLEIVASKRDILVDNNHNREIENWINTYGDLQKHLELPEKEICILDKNLFKHDLFLKPPFNKVGEPTVILFTRSLVDRIGYFREDLQQILDYEFYYRVLKKYKIAIVNKKLAAFRIHGMQASNINKSNNILDHELYPKIMYREFFWYLNMKEKKKLFLRYNKFGRYIKNFK